jgi:hypothetical protein
MNQNSKLIFVSMGMDYKERFPGDVCNHRIRTELVNPHGRKFFIEVGTGRGDKMRIDHVIDRDQELEYAEKAHYYLERIKESKMVPQKHPLWDSYKKYMEQPHQWYRYKEWQGLSLEYTKENVLKLVNRLFECNYTEMELTEDYSAVFSN